ncbi:oxidoreductase NAD-binding domain protein [Corynebacterium ammoniagenes DSM 20306]|nr:NADH oxidase [Corynebacterium ammoniagenes]EFG81675.1 oxidoreductase NAD-binding domain protein [Corynebacterium ammoniagenes DSM 20306]
MCTWSNSQTAFDFSDTRIFKEGMKMSTKTEHKIALAFEDGITKFIPCAEDQTVADAAYQSKINIPFDCRDGACGTCKAFCESGDFDEGEFVDDAMTQDELDNGFCLPCQSKPRSDMVLQIRTTSVLAKTGPETFSAEVTKVGALSDTVFELELEVEDRERLNFLPGQYVNITVPGSTETRSYSFATGPEVEKIGFLIKNTPDGLMTNWLKDVAKVGDKLEFEGPMGSFFLREPLQPVLLLAGGTGLAPVMSIMESLANDELLDVPVRLIYGANTSEDLVRLEEIAAYKDRIEDFDFFTVLSQEEGHERCGFVTDHMDPTEHLADGEADSYLCGPPPMVEAVRKYFDSHDTPPLNFYYEKFNANQQPGAAEAQAETGEQVAEKAERVAEKVGV